MDNPKPPMHGRDHRQGGADPIPGIGEDDWVPITSFTNSWADNSTSNGTNADPPVSYIEQTNGWVGLRGRLICGTEGTAAFRMPVGLRPPYDMWYSVNVGTGGAGALGIELAAPSHSGSVLVNGDGYVLPYLNAPGFGGYSPTVIIDPFASTGSTFTIPPPYVQPSPGLYRVQAGGGLGINAAIATLANLPLLYVGNERFIDGEVWATITADCTSLLLGQRMQSYPGLTFTPQPGYFMELGTAVGGDLKFHVVLWNSSNPFTTPTIASTTFNSGTTPQFNNPGYGAGDTLRFQLINNGVFLFHGAAGSNDAPVFSLTNISGGNVPVISSGYFGLGCNGPGTTSLVTAWGGGMPRQNTGVGSMPLGASLDSIRFKVA